MEHGDGYGGTYGEQVGKSCRAHCLQWIVIWAAAMDSLDELGVRENVDEAMNFRQKSNR